MGENQEEAEGTKAGRTATGRPPQTPADEEMQAQDLVKRKFQTEAWTKIRSSLSEADQQAFDAQVAALVAEPALKKTCRGQAAGGLQLEGAQALQHAAKVLGAYIEKQAQGQSKG